MSFSLACCSHLRFIQSTTAVQFTNPVVGLQLVIKILRVLQKGKFAILREVIKMFLRRDKVGFLDTLDTL